MNEDSIDSNEEIGNIEEIEKNDSLYASFVDGSSLRNLVEYIRLINLEGVFRFHEKIIYYEQGDEDNNILNVVKIKGHELTAYDFYSSTGCISSKINLADFRNITRTVNKKDQLVIYKREDEPGYLYVQVKSQDKSSSGEQLYPLPMKMSDYQTYDLPTYDRGDKDPTCTIHQCDISKFLKSMVTIRCSYIMIHGYEKGIVIKGYLSTGEIGSIKEYGKIYINSNNKYQMKSAFKIYNKNIVKSKEPTPKLNIRDAGEIERYKIDIKIVKALTKLNGLSPTGTIKFYIQRDTPLKMVCNIGSFGKLSIYLRSSDE